MKIVYKVSAEEIGPMIRFIGETFKLGSNPANTGRGKRLWNDILGTREQEASEWVTKCKRWYSKGVPEEIELTYRDLDTLRKLERYCYSL